MFNCYKEGKIVRFLKPYLVVDCKNREEIRIQKGDIGEIVKAVYIPPSSSLWNTFMVDLYVIMKNGTRVFIKGDEVDSLVEVLDSSMVHVLYGDN